MSKQQDNGVFFRRRRAAVFSLLATSAVFLWMTLSGLVYILDYPQEYAQKGITWMFIGILGGALAVYGTRVLMRQDPQYWS